MTWNYVKKFFDFCVVKMVELVIFTVFCAIAWCSIEKTFDIAIVAGMESINVKKIIALGECDDDDNAF